MEPVQDQPLVAQPPAGVEDESLQRQPVAANSESEPTRLRRTLRASVIAAETNDVPFINEFMKMTNREDQTLRGRTGQQILLEQADAQREWETQQVMGLFLERGAENGADPQVIADAIDEVQRESLELGSDPARGTKQYVGSMVRNIDPETRADLEVRLELLDQLAPLAEDISGWEIAGNLLLEVALAPKVILDNWQFTGDPNVFGHQAKVQQVIGWFQALPPEQKREFFPILQEMALEAMPRARAVQFMSALIDPTAEEAATDEFGLWPLIDAAAIAAGIAGLAFRLRKGLNAARAAATAGDYKKAADTNVAILQSKDDDLGELLDIPRITARNNADPFDQTGADDAAAAVISPAVHERIFQFRDKVKEVFGKLDEGRTFEREGLLDENDRISAMERIEKEFESYIQARFQGRDKPVNMKRSKQDDPRGVTFEFEVTNADGTIIKDTYRGTYVLDDVGRYKTLPGASFFKSLKAQVARTDFMSMAEGALRLDLTSANVGKQLRDLTAAAVEPIKKGKGLTGVLMRKTRIKQVDDVLLAGDDGLKEFTPEELKAGVNGIVLDEDQIEAYYNLRGVLNGLGILRNMDTRASMLARGVKELKIGTQNLSFGTPFDLEQARRRLSGSRGEIKTIFKQDGPLGGPQEVSRLDLDAEYAKGFRLVRLEQDAMINGKRYQHVLVKSDELNELPSVVVDIKKGYVPRINPKALYFVQAFTPNKLDGVDSQIRKAVRSFDNKKEADEFAEALQNNLDAEGFDPRTQIRVNTDKELEAFRAGDSGLGGAHGLVHSPRARNKVPHNDGDASDVPRTSALEAIELYLENSKNFLSRNDWRMGVQEKWENTARYMLPGNRDITFENPGAALDNADLARAHTIIRDLSGFRDKSENMWEATVRGAHEWAVTTKGRGRMSEFLLNRRLSDPLAVMRSITFHSLLGMFNPIQLWVQAQGAAVAFGINLTNPKRLAKVFQQTHGLAALQRNISKNLTDAQLKKLAKISGFKNVEELKAMKELWDRSGLFQSVLSSADVEAAARGFPSTAGMVKRFANSGLMFFRTGEVFNRRMAFLTAVDELGGAAAVAKSSNLLKQAMSRANDLILNLGKANRAQWQKGLYSVPTQFMQIQAKTIESVLGMNGAFTRAERTNLMLAQLGLYGSAGVFGGNWVLRNIMSGAGMDQIDIDNLPAGTVKALNGGFTDWFANFVGADITAADRGALLNGMDQTVLSFFTEETTLFNWLGGPSSVAPTRLFNRLQQMSPWFATPQDTNGETEVTMTEVSDVLRRVGTDIVGVAASPFATTSQINKFFLMRDLNSLVDKNGNEIARPIEGFNPMTEWAALIGWKPDLLQRKFDLSELNQARRDYVEFRTNMLLRQFDRFLMASNRARDEGRDLTDEELRQHRVDYLVLVDSLNPEVRREVMKRFRGRIGRRARPGGSQLDRQQREFWDNMVIDLTDAVYDDLRGKGIRSDDTRLIQVQPANELTIQEE